MEELKQRVLAEGRLLSGDIVRVDRFLNHQVDVALLERIGNHMAGLFRDEGVTRVLTVEASGIAPALFAARALGVPLVYAKKYRPGHLSDDAYSAELYSYTKRQEHTVRVSKACLFPGDRVLIVDDFLAQGMSCLALLEIAAEAGAEVAGIAVAVEKGFQDGGKKLRERGVRVEPLCCIDRIEDGKLYLR
jgi:xanthine phosphoribosyltransferase